MTEELFSEDDIKQFDADDNAAGKAIGKMLSLFFFYTVIAMTITGLWTYMSLG